MRDSKANQETVSMNNVGHVKKVLFYVGATDRYGGPQLNALEVGKIIRPYGCEIAILSLCNEIDRAQRDELRDNDIRFISTNQKNLRIFNKLRNIMAFLNCRKVIGFKSQDIIVGMGQGGFHYFLDYFLDKHGFMIHRETGSGIIFSKKMKYLFLSYLDKADGILVLSKTAYINMKRNTFSGERIKILPELVPDISKGIRRTSLLETSPILRIAYIGRIDEHKGILDLLAIWPTLNIGPAVLQIYGHGNTSIIEEINGIIRDKGMKNVSLLGSYSRQDLHQILSQNDMVVLLTRDASKGEGLPTVLIESMCMGVPFLGTNVACISDLSLNNPDVIVVGNDKESIAEGFKKMAHFIRNGLIKPSRLQNYYRDHFSFETVSRGWINAILEPQKFWSLSQK